MYRVRTYNPLTHNTFFAEVFRDESIQKCLQFLGWLSLKSKDFKHFFTEQKDARVLENLRSITIQRHASDSHFCGVYDGLLGRVLFNLRGYRFIMGAKVDS